MCMFLQEVNLVHTLVVLTALIIEDIYLNFDFKFLNFVIKFDHRLSFTLEAHILVV